MKVSLSFSKIQNKDMKTFLPFSLQHREKSCVSGIRKHDLYPGILFCYPKKFWCCLIQCNETDKNQLLFLYPGSSLKCVQGRIKRQSRLGYTSKFDATRGLFWSKNLVKYLLSPSRYLAIDTCKYNHLYT